MRGRSLDKSNNSWLEFLFAAFLDVKSDKWRACGFSYLDETPTLIPNVNMSFTIENVLRRITRLTVLAVIPCVAIITAKGLGWSKVVTFKQLQAA